MELQFFEFPGDEYNGYYYGQFLNSLVEADREHGLKVIRILAMRSAMRVMPLMVSEGHLNFWMADDRDDRVLHLAEVLSLLVFPLDGRTFKAYSAMGVPPPPDLDEMFPSMKALVDSFGAVEAAFAFSRTYYDEDIVAAAVDVSDVDPATHRAEIYESLKIDIKHLREVAVDIELGSLWWGKTPEWFISSLRKLESIVAQLPRVESDQVEWGTIQAGLNLLWSEAGVPRPSSSDLTIDLDAPAGEANQSSADSSTISFSFLSTNQSNPENPSATDKLNRQKLVNALATNLTHSTNRHHRAIGLLGEWGSGKSTVLKLLKQKLKETHKEQPFVFGEFNAWSYEHSDNIQAGIAQEVLNAVTSVETYEIPEKHKDEQKVAYLQRSLRPRMLNALWRPIKSFVLRPWITFWFSLRTQKL